MKSVYSLFCILALLSCTSKHSYQKLPDGVVVQMNSSTQGKSLRLQVISDKIIRVTVSPSDSFATDKSLILLDTVPKPGAWSVSEDHDRVVISTKYVHASLSLISCEVEFTDMAGNVLLQEKKGGGKSFESVSYDNEKMYAIRQVFESPDDEAFYGLGQHQEGVMNYKGKDVSLFQYNTKVSVPFLVSNKNYGILWDNYSLSKFGDEREYQSLSKLKLFAKDGKEGEGLTGTYFSKTDSSNVYLTRNDSVLNYESLKDQKRFPKEFPLQEGKAVWQGSIGSNENGVHKFFLYYAGYIKVWVNGELKADHWRQAWNPGTVSFTTDMEVGKKYPVRIEWIPDGGESYLSLKWQYLPVAEQNRLSIYSEAADQIDYYFIAGNNMDDVISGYRSITGKAEIFPKWAMGLWQSRERYKTQKEILDVVSAFRKRKIPLDNIVQDWSYWKQDQWGSHDFDTERFPDAAGMVKELHEKYHTHFMISVWPKFYEGTENYAFMDSKGWLYKKNIQNRQRDWIGKGYVSTFYDPYSAPARAAFWDLMYQKLYTKGIDAWWMDATEPDILSNASLQERKELMNPTALGTSTKYFNAYALMNEKGIYEGQRKADPDKRVFILTRSAFAGSQRYAAATWSGDIGANWQDFKTQIPAGLNFCLSGIPYWATDIGGFSVERKFEKATGEELEEWRERMTRWFQFGTFCPLFRVHGQYPFREMFNVAPDTHPAYQSMLYYDKMRYKLLPYIYSLTASTYFNDYTIMRALVMDFPADKNVLAIGNEYLFGPALLIAPVTSYKARTWPVYLPAGSLWYEMNTGKQVSGGQTVQAVAPMERMPMYVRGGSIIPTGPDLQYTAEKLANPITLYVYTGADGSFNLYEDDGLTYQYQKGQHANIPFEYNEASGVLKIGERQGTFAGMLTQRSFKIVFISKDKAIGFDESTTGVTVDYSGKEVMVKR